MSWYDDLAKAGRTPSTRLLDYSSRRIDADVREAIDAGDLVDEDFVRIAGFAWPTTAPRGADELSAHRFTLAEDDLAKEGLYACTPACAPSACT